MSRGKPNKRYTPDGRGNHDERKAKLPRQQWQTKENVGKIAPNLLNRDFYADKPNQKWVTDVTEFSLFWEKLYLSPILDLHSSDLVSYTISDRPVLSMVTTMLDKAFAKIPDGTDLILHFGLLKSELLYLQEFHSMEHFKQELIEYLDCYNNRRIRQNERACRLQFTDSKPFRLLEQFLR